MGILSITKRATAVVSSTALTGVVATIMMMGASLTPTPAEAAGCCGTLYNLITRKHSETRQNVNDHTTQVGNYIVDNILKATQQLSAYEQRTAESNKRVEEGAQANETIRTKQRFRAEAEGGRYDPAISACTDMSGIMKMGGGASTQGYGGNDMANISRNRSNGNGVGGQEVRENGLALAQGILSDRDRLQNIGGVLDPTTDVRLLTENITLDTTDNDVASAYARLINNIVDPTPAKPVTVQEMKTPNGMAAAAARQIDAARRSSAHAVFGFYGDLITPAGGDELAEWAQRAKTDAYPNVVGDKVSILQATDIFVHSKFANPEWHQQVAKASPAAVQREIATTNALNLHVNWLRFQLELRDAAVNATDLAARLDDRDSSNTTSTVTNASSAGTGFSAPTGVVNISAGI